jgi:hypothetical protein
MRCFCLIATLLAVLSLPAAAQQSEAADKELIRLESTKWDPMSLLHPRDLMALFSEDMLSIDYGSDLQGGVERRTWTEVLGYGSALPSWSMKLSDWKVLHPTPDVAIVSYKVTGVSVQWKAYATSTWARRDGKWQTVFYQASTAK